MSRKRCCLLSAGLVMISLLAIERLTLVPAPLFAQDDPVAPRATSTPVPPLGVPLAPMPEVKDALRALRENALKTYTRKLELMNEDQLQRELQQSQVSLSELEAAKRLESIQSSLLELTELYPGTDAAKTAARMRAAATIDDAPEPMSPTRPFGPLRSDPDDGFRDRRAPVRSQPVNAVPDPLEPAFAAPPFSR